MKNESYIHYLSTMALVLFLLYGVLPLMVRCKLNTVVGFDCAHPSVNKTPISTIAITPCTHSPSSTVFKSEQVTVLLKDRYHAVQTYSCFVQRAIMILTCSPVSLFMTVDNGFVINEIIPVTFQDCLHIHQHKSYTTAYQNVLENIAPNTSTLFTVTEIGQNPSISHPCKGDYFRYNNKDYQNVVVQSSYTITVKNEYRPVNTYDNTILLEGLYSVDFNQGYSFTPTLGYTFWFNDIYNSTCQFDHYTLLYRGPIQVFNYDDKRLAVITDKSMQVGILIHKEIQVCDYHMYITNYHGLIIIKGELSDKDTVVDHIVGPNDIHVFLYLDSKAILIEHAVYQSMFELYRKIFIRDCELAKHNLIQLLTLVYISPADFAWSLTQQPGVIALPRGEVVYLLQCQPVLVEVASQKECYFDLPIYYHGAIKFLRPRTRVIVDQSEQVSCDNDLLPIYNINNKWLSTNGKDQTYIQPSTLRVVSMKIPNSTHNSLIMSSGLYDNRVKSKYELKHTIDVTSTSSAVNHLPYRAKFDPLLSFNGKCAANETWIFRMGDGNIPIWFIVITIINTMCAISMIGSLVIKQVRLIWTQMKSYIVFRRVTQGPTTSTSCRESSDRQREHLTMSRVEENKETFEPRITRSRAKTNNELYPNLTRPIQF